MYITTRPEILGDTTRPEILGAGFVYVNFLFFLLILGHKTFFLETYVCVVFFKKEKRNL